MKGVELKETLVRRGVVLSELSSKLGITPQGLSTKLNVKNVKPDFIKQIEEIVGFSLEDIPQTNTETQQFLELLKKKDEQMDRLITLLEHKYGIDERKNKNVG